MPKSIVKERRIKLGGCMHCGGDLVLEWDGMEYRWKCLQCSRGFDTGYKVKEYKTGRHIKWE